MMPSMRLKRGVELDPLSLILNAELGVAYYCARQFDQAITQFRKTLGAGFKLRLRVLVHRTSL